MISLVVTCYNRASLVGPCIASIRAQTSADWELSVVDDGSADGSVAAATAAAQGDPRIKIFALPHYGVNGTVKDYGVRQASGPWCACVDSDDTLAPTAVAEAAAALAADPTAGVLYTDRLLVTRQGGPGRPDPFNRLAWSMAGLLERFITRPLFVYRKDLYLQTGGYNPALRFAADYDLALKLSELSPVLHLARPLYLRTVSPHTLSQQNRAAQGRCACLAQLAAYQRRGFPIPARLQPYLPTA